MPKKTLKYSDYADWTVELKVSLPKIALKFQSQSPGKDGHYK